MPYQRVVVTGLGTVSALGLDTGSFWNGIVNCCPNIQVTECSFHHQTSRFPAARVPGYVPERFFTKSELLLCDAFTQFALLASREALSDAGFEPGDAGARQVAVILGAGCAGESSREAELSRYLNKGTLRCHPMLVPKMNAQASVSMVCAAFGFSGPAYTVSTGCASATHAIGQAFHLVRSGVVSYAVTGGSEAPITYLTQKAFEALRVLAPDTCRPFSRERQGMVLGEGSGILFLEALSSARKRGANIYAELVGSGMSVDARDPVHPTAAGAAEAMRVALDDAGIDYQRVDYVNAHGTGTVVNDVVETQALCRLFGNHAGQLAVSSTKSLHGHAIGASGALECIATILALRHGVIPPTANYLGFDEGCSLDYVPNEARQQVVKTALSNSFAFGGLNGALVLKKFE